MVDEIAVEQHVKAALTKIEDAYHEMMRDLLKNSTADAHITAALMSVAQFSAAFGIGRVVQVQGAEILPSLANPFLQKSLQSACDVAGVKARVVLDTGEQEVRVH